MTEGEKEKYTRREAGKELTLIENHLRGFDPKRPDFCMECVGKHLLHLAGLADEGKGFFPKDVGLWSDIGNWANELMDKGEHGELDTLEKALEAAGQARHHRKKIQERYMGPMGKCACITGFEECCPHSKRAN